ncbi:MAG TPA: thiamine-phosphate kinase [Allosphingosinicella sp.]|nr:thiamine-phosphate kinase [Allosphingosinicella sp.]
MSGESRFIDSLRALVTDPAARELLDDAAVLEVGSARLVLTHDIVAEGVHFLPGDPPGDVAWKLVAVNLSDLAAKGARPLGALLGYSLAADGEWNSAFVEGLRLALDGFGLKLLGGDTICLPEGAPRAFGLTAIGEASGPVPSRSGAKPGDHLWVSGTIGDAGAGLAVARGELHGAASLIERYRLPRPRLEAGQALAPLVSAMMDVSDGLLIDLARMAEASGVAAVIELDTVPLSEAYIAARGEEREARIAAATAGDDYELLFSADPAQAPAILAASDALGLPFSRIGHAFEGQGLRLTDRGGEVPLPTRLGYQHRSS